ncbi:MAG: FGGY-family carbohydrate kinase [Planctomycetia bacterium]|nr:FGGY-family carbohydrate kinase [Planctomycetia bacterium]
MTSFILACDLGTGGNKASLYDENGTLCGAVMKPYETHYPKPGFHEQRPDDWWYAVTQSIRELLAKTGANPMQVRAIALSGHSLGCVPLDEHGSLLRDTTPIWSDSRAEKQAAAFFRENDYKRWYQTTGAGFPPAHYTLFKLLWYRENLPDLFRKMAVFLGTKDYVNYRMTGRAVTDFSYASGTGAYALDDWAYSDEILAASGLPRSIFPEIVPSTEAIGTLTSTAAKELGLPQSVVVVAGGVDNSCMALGAKCYQSGRSYASLGSSSWIAVSDAKPLLDHRFKPYVFTHVVPGQFASAIGVFSTGTTLKWVLHHFCTDFLHEAEARGENPYARFMEHAALSPPGAHGLLLNPSFAGGSSLEPSGKMRGGLFGLDLSHTLHDIARATLEGIALNLRKATDALGSLTTLSDRMVLVGGGAISPIWRRIYADVFHQSVEKTNIDQDAAALGAFALAAVGTGLWDDFSPIDALHQTEEILTPDPETAAIYEKILPKFLRTAEMLAELETLII